MSAIPVIPSLTENPDARLAIDHYRTAYRTATREIRLADNMNYGGTFIAGVLVIAAIFVYQAIPSERFDFPFISGSILASAVILVLTTRFLGMAFRLHGRMMDLVIDAAVNSSPVLTNAQRSNVMFENEGKLVPPILSEPKKIA